MKSRARSSDAESRRRRQEASRSAPSARAAVQSPSNEETSGKVDSDGTPQDDRRHKLSPRQVLAVSLAGAVLALLAFPPFGLWPLAFVAPAPWIWLARRGVQGWRSYFAIWIGGLVFWLALLQGIRLAHVALYLGWIALSAYVAAYLPLFVGLTSLAVERCRWPLIVAAPVVWTGLELARGVFLTGFSLGLLGHALVEQTTLIQIADLGGAYAVSFLAVFVAACLARAAPSDRYPWVVWPLAPALAAVCLAIAYGQFRMRDQGLAQDRPSLKVALIQGSVDTIFEYDPERYARTFRDYREQTLRVRAEHPDLDLIVWPESIYTGNEPEYLLEDEANVPPDAELSPERFRSIVLQYRDLFELKNRVTTSAINELVGQDETRQLQIHCLVGVETVKFGQATERYNSALLLDPDGGITGRYYKMHPVMFGEYVPFGDRFPWLYGLTPMSGGLTPGPGPAAFEVAGMRISPSICFESTVPHLIRRQWRDLTSQGKSPNLLVCLTNDGWFWGSSILDHHLACSTFRAVELRTPMLVAANTGFSAVIDGDGRAVIRGPRRAAAELVARVAGDPRGSLYARFGDLGAALCLLACGAIVLISRIRRPRYFV